MLLEMFETWLILNPAIRHRSPFFAYLPVSPK